MHQRHELEKMTVPQIKGLVRKHNLHTTYMKGYSKLRKADLITKLIAHTPVRGDAPAKAAAPKKKHAARHKPKMTAHGFSPVWVRSCGATALLWLNRRRKMGHRGHPGLPGVSTTAGWRSSQGLRTASQRLR